MKFFDMAGTCILVVFFIKLGPYKVIDIKKKILGKSLVSKRKGNSSSLGVCLGFSGTAD